MSTSLILNPQYMHLEEFVKNLPSIFDSTGVILQDARNTIKVIEHEGIRYNVKRFRKPIFINRIVYTFFRKSKGYKAYFNALEVIKRGFKTPVPVAYLELKSAGLIDYSYFISLQLDESIEELRNYYFTKLDNQLDKLVIASLSQYTAHLHKSEILHMDYSSGNVMCKVKENKIDFYLVDINRMKFQKVQLSDACKSVSRLFEYDDTMRFFAKEYATALNLDVEKCTHLMLKYKHDYEQYRERKDKLKNIFN